MPVRIAVAANPQTSALSTFMPYLPSDALALVARPSRDLRCHVPALHLLQRYRGVDETDVGEALREVAEGGAGVRIHFLGEEAQVVAIAEQRLESVGRAVDVAGT